MSAALTTLSGVAKLATVARMFVRDTPAPEPCFLTLDTRENQIDLQPSVPHCRDPVVVLGALLIWTHRLTGLTGSWRHTSDEHLHIILAGRGPAGVRIRVYSSIRFEQACGHVALVAGVGESVTRTSCTGSPSKSGKDSDP
ncbi:hypothetical protein AB0F52_01585 [Amycolatopsis sp. NPDC024027]|uniref:hypothetical protein n=1 Tax=Amycolatopsis sp. NPDC024027 TaxID=3154327 RepID=UPI00340EBBA7